MGHNCNHRNSVSDPGMDHKVDFDDVTRYIRIIEPGNQERTRVARVLFDSGSALHNTIDSKLVSALGLTPWHKRPSSWKKVLHKLFPFTQAAKDVKQQSRSLLQSIDGTIIKGQNGFVTISWFGINPSGLNNPIVHFQPRRYETTHRIVDTKAGGPEIIMSWKEVFQLGLRGQVIAPIRSPPKEEFDQGGAIYEDYEQRRAAGAKARFASRTNSQPQQPEAGPTNQTGK